MRATILGMQSHGKYGQCHICYRVGPLTFEHIPPRRCFNDAPTIAHTINGLAASSRHQKNMPIARKFRRGMGADTLCSECNGFTGHHYGEAFAEWAEQAMHYAQNYEGRGGSENKILLPFHIRPLHVIKQIATMALAAADLPNIDAHYDLRRFVLMPFEQYLPSKYTFRVYLNPKRKGWKLTQNRLSGFSTSFNVETGRSTSSMADIAFPPLGYVIAFTNSGFRLTEETEKLTEINAFGHFRYRERATVFLQMPVELPIGPARFESTPG